MFLVFMLYLFEVKLRNIQDKLKKTFSFKKEVKSIPSESFDKGIVAHHHGPEISQENNTLLVSSQFASLETAGDSLTEPKVLTLKERFPDYQFGQGTYDTNLQIHTWGEGATLKIGAFCSIASGVQIFLGGEHRIDWVTTYPFNVLWDAGRHLEGHPATKGNVLIGNDVWIGSDAVILSGVTVGDGAVIGARAVVAKDVPPYSIVVGNPARVIRMRFDEVTIQKLLRIQWWNWERDRIEAALPLLLNSDIAAFLETAETIL